MRTSFCVHMGGTSVPCNRRKADRLASCEARRKERDQDFRNPNHDQSVRRDVNNEPWRRGLQQLRLPSQPRGRHCSGLHSKRLSRTGNPTCTERQHDLLPSHRGAEGHHGSITEGQKNNLHYEIYLLYPNPAVHLCA